MMQLLLLSSLCLDNMPEQSNDYRVVVFGAGGVGKSSLVLRFVRGTFRDSYIPTIEDTYRQVISCNKQVLYLLSSSSLYFHFSLISLLFLRPSFSLILLRLLLTSFPIQQICNQVGHYIITSGAIFSIRNPNLFVNVVCFYFSKHRQE